MKRLLFLLLIFTGAVACNSRKSSPKIDDKVYRIFADSLETAIKTGDVDFLKSHFDKNFLIDRICDSLDIPSRKKKQNDYLFESYIDVEMDAFSGISGYGEYGLLRMMKSDDGKKALFRLRTPEGGINYHVFSLGSMGGRVGIRDVERFVTGESCYENVAKNMQYFADDLPEKIRAKFECGDQAKAIDGYNAENKYEDAHNTYKYLSAECRNSKPMIISYLKTCTADSSAELANMADDALRSHPIDPIIALNLIDCYYALERYDAILKCINIVDSTVQDPQLDYIRANVYFAKNDFETALKLFYTIGENQPGSIRTDAWKSIVNIKIYQNKPEEALAVCKMLVDKKYFSKTDIKDVILEDQFLFQLLPEVEEWLGGEAAF